MKNFTLYAIGAVVLFVCPALVAFMVFGKPALDAEAECERLGGLYVRTYSSMACISARRLDIPESA